MYAQAKGTFEVKLSPLPTSAQSQAAGVSRMSIDKRLLGDLEATSAGEMLAFSADVDGSAVYVAIERVTGSLHGRAGSFVLHHRGIMTRGAPQLTISVAPDSGTGQLAGLTGQMTIDIVDGAHFYELKYVIEE